MIRMLAYLLLLVGLMAGVVWLADHPGTVQLDAFGYRLETSLMVLLCALVALMVSVGLIILVIRALIGIPTSIHARRVLSHQRKGLDAITHTLTALASANWPLASRQLQQAGKQLGHDHPVVLLLGTQLAHAQGKRETVRHQLSAMLKHEQTRLIGLRGMIEQAMQDGDESTALAHAKEALAAQPSDRWLRLVMLDVLARQKQWAEAERQLRHARKHQALSTAELRRYEALLELMQAREALADGNHSHAAQHAARAWKLDASFAPIASLQLDCLQHQGQHRAWHRTIRQAWKLSPRHELGSRMLHAIAQEKPTTQRKLVEKLVAYQPDHAESYLLQAQLALKQARYDDARQHLRAALGLQESVRIYQLFADTLQAEGGQESQIQEWLRRAATAPAEACWHCAKCDHRQPEWSLHCSSCKAFDSFIWQAEEASLVELEKAAQDNRI